MQTRRCSSISRTQSGTSTTSAGLILSLMLPSFPGSLPRRSPPEPCQRHNARTMANPPADPTLCLLDALRDPERFVCVPGMPVFVPHVRTDDDGNVEALVDGEELQRIADTINDKIARHGRPVRITCGHVK